MAEDDAQAGAGALARRESDATTPWRGDEHKLAVEAADEAGLDAREAELASYTEGFKQGMVIDDPDDRSIVLFGRTVLNEKEFRRAITPMIRFLQLPRDQVALRIHDGEFELRVGRGAADAASPALDSAKVALRVWIAAGLLGWALSTVGQAFAMIVWGLGLLVGGWVLRQGLVNGRSLLAARLTVGLAMLAQEEQLILPPAKAPPKPDAR